MVFELTTQQKRFLECPCSVMAVEGPAGTGKTTIAALKAARLAEELPLAFQRVLFLTFTNNATDRIREAIEEHVPIGLRPRIHVTNYHGFFFRLIRSWGRYAGLPTNWAIMPPAERLAMCRLVSTRHGLRVRGRATDADPWFCRVQSIRAGYIPAGRLPSKLVEESADSLRAANRAGSIHFDDFEFYARWLLSNSRIAECYRREYPFIIVDEFQDITEVQCQVVRLLTPEHLVVLGDRRQSIYRWVTGVSPTRFRDFVAETGATLHPMTTNHRNAGAGEANALAAGVAEIGRDRRLLTGRRPIPTSTNLRWYPCNAKLHAHRLAVRILRGERRLNRVVACLTPTNVDVRTLAASMAENGVRHVALLDTMPQIYLENTMLAAAGYLSTNSEEDWLTLGRALNHLSGTSIWLRAFRLKGPVLEAFGDDDAVGRFSRSLLAIPQGMTADRAMAEATVLVSRLVQDEGVGDDTLLPEAVGRVGEAARIADLRRLGHSRLAQALTETRIADELYGRTRLRRGITVMTMHKAKGKEFDLAFLFAPNEGEFLSRNDPEDQEALEEETQVWYVALSRQRECLHVFYDQNRPSRYLRPFCP